MTIIWSDEAVDNLESACIFIRRQSPKNAGLVVDRIQDIAALLETSPMLGKVGEIEDTREFPVPKTPFLLVYRLEQNRVLILAILHGAQEWPRSRLQ